MPASEAPARKTLLIVDDEEGPRQSLNVIFKNDYDILMASSGEDALDVASANHIDVAVLDIRMDGMSGTELLAELKKRDPRIEVMMLTAYETMDTAKEAIRNGACDYLSKPFEIPVVKEAVAIAMQRRALSEDLAGSRERLDQLQTELQDQQLKGELARTQNEIYESVMHDIGSPLTAISVLIQILNQDLESTRGDADPKMVRGQLEKVNQQVGRCIALTRRYLDYARQRASGQAEVRVNQCLKDVQELVSANPFARDNNIDIQPLMVDVKAKINGTDLIQILINLVVNALQATERPHGVSLSSEYVEVALDAADMAGGDDWIFMGKDEFANETPMVAVHVEDDGDGMTPDILVKIFDSYFSTKAPGKGTGLGLAIVRRLLVNAKGAMRVQSTPGKGSRFTVFVGLAFD